MEVLFENKYISDEEFIVESNDLKKIKVFYLIIAVGFFILGVGEFFIQSFNDKFTGMNFIGAVIHFIGAFAIPTSIFNNKLKQQSEVNNGISPEIITEITQDSVEIFNSCSQGRERIFFSKIIKIKKSKLLLFINRCKKKNCNKKEFIHKRNS